MKRSKKLDGSQRKLTDFWVQKPVAASAGLASLSSFVETRTVSEVSVASSVSVVEMNDDDSRASTSSNASAAAKGVKRKGGFYGSQWNDSGQKRNCPSYKRIPGTPYVVDAFSYGVIPAITGYFLSHFHSDHYNGLTKSFSQPIYCSLITANLINLKFGVAASLIHVLHMNQPQRLQDGTLVTLFDANHCPGSVLFLFETLTGNFLHTGDLRAEDCLIDQLKSKSLPKLDILFLDTTYMNPRYVFPPQKAVIDEVCRFVKTELERYPKTLVVCGTYMIGKERVVQAIAETMGSKIAVNRPKMNIIKCLNDEKLTSRLTLDYKSTNLFVVFGSSSLKQLQDTLAQHSRFHRLINVWPSGWEYRKGGPILSVKPSGNITIVGAPYSEHSSYGELEKLVRALRPARIVPTVNVSKNEEMQKTFSQWLAPANISQIFK